MTARSLLARSPARLIAHSALSALALVIAAMGGGCSGDTGGSGGGGTGGAPPAGLCFQNPLACGDGTVCAFDDEDGKSMTCLPAGSKSNGDACVNTAGAPECGEELVCLQLKGATEGHCTLFCDAAGDCSGGLECAQITTDGGNRFFACAKL